MAFAEASYSVQTSEDMNLCPATHPNNSSSGHREPFPPELFASLNVTPLTPPPSDKVRLQSLRFPTDLYTPQFVRNHGIEREGWCGLCRPGRWLVLKNSAFWYDKSFMHGISAASGTRFEEPVEVRRTTGKVSGEGEGKGVGQGDGWEGLCGTCGIWMTLGGGRRGCVPWFRHAFKVNLELPQNLRGGAVVLMTAVSYAPQGAGYTQKETGEQGRQGIEDDEV